MIKYFENLWMWLEECELGIQGFFVTDGRHHSILGLTQYRKTERSSKALTFKSQVPSALR